MLVSKKAKICVTPNAKPKIYITPNANSQRESVEYIGYVGSPGIGACIGHVHFMLFASISFALGSQCKRGFQWNMGLTYILYIRVSHIFMSTPSFSAQYNTLKIPSITNKCFRKYTINNNQFMVASTQFRAITPKVCYFTCNIVFCTDCHLVQLSESLGHIIIHQREAYKAYNTIITAKKIDIIVARYPSSAK